MFKPRFDLFLHFLHPSLVLGWATLSGDRPQFLGHKGGSFYVPGNTIPAFKLAVYEYADTIDTDIVLTADGVPVCHHDLGLKASTDIADHPEFAHLLTQGDDWMIFNFTVKPLKTLKLNQVPVGVRPRDFNGVFSIPTLSQFIEVVHSASLQVNRTVGLSIELKRPKLHNAIFNGIPNYMECVVLDVLGRAGYSWNDKNRPTCSARDTRFGPKSRTRVLIPCGQLILKSFEAESLKFIGKIAMRGQGFGLMQLISADVTLLTPGGFWEMAGYVDSIGIFKEYLTTGVVVGAMIAGLLNPSGMKPRDIDLAVVEERGGFLSASEIVPLAHKLGMEIGVYTFYDSRENSLFFCGLGCWPLNRKRELFYHFDSGVDFLAVENVPEAAAIGMEYVWEVLHGRSEEFI